MMIPKVTSGVLRSTLRPSGTLTPSFLRPYPRLPPTPRLAPRRFAHAIPKPPSKTASNLSSSSSSSTSSAGTSASTEGKPRKLLEPHYELTFTCVPCSGRSTHAVSKQGYHRGSVLITCPSCRNRHIISDHLDIFGNKKITIEDLMREKGQLVKRGTLGEDGDIEFWEDGTTTERGAGSKAGTTTGTAESSPDELVATKEEEDEATGLRDTRNPSSQSTQPAPSHVSVSPGWARTRPTVDSSASSHTVPSTRRQYHTGPSSDPDKSNVIPRKVWTKNIRKPPDTDPLGSHFFRKVTGDNTPFTHQESRLIRSGWRAPIEETGLHMSIHSGIEKDSPSRISRDAWAKNLGVLHRRSIVTPFSDGTQFNVFSYVPTGDVFTKVKVDPVTNTRYRGENDLGPHTADGEPGRTTVRTVRVRAIPSEARFNGFRFTNLRNDYGEKPRWVRAGPGSFTRQRRPPGGPSQDSRENPSHAPDNSAREMEKLTAQSRASSDLWGNKNVTKKMRDMIDQFVDKDGHSPSFR